MNNIHTNSNLKQFYFQWHITDKCNLRCSHCYQNGYTNESDLSLEDLKGISNKLFQTLSKWDKKGDISVTGGEPFIRKDIFSFLEYLNSSKNVARLDVLSNGTLITHEIAKKLKEFPKLKFVQISLDGASGKTHDSIRGNGAFNKALRGIRTLNYHGIETKVMFTLQRSNMEEVRSLFDLAIKENISGITFERLVPMGTLNTSTDSCLTREELKEIFHIISDRSDLEYKKGTNLRVLKYRPLWINIDPTRAKFESNTDPYNELGAVCSIGLDGLCIMPDATVYPCRRLPIPIGNLKSDSIEKIWFQSDLLLKIRDKNNLKDKCKTCEFIPRCSGCRAMAYAYTGDYLAEDPQCWK